MMPIGPKKTTVCLTLVLLVFAAISSCGKDAVEQSYTIPRGVTISISTEEPISASEHRTDATFAAVLESPLTKGSNIFAPAGAKVDGVIDEVSQDENGLPQVTIRAIRLHLPSGGSLELDTAPITRGARASFAAAGEIRADFRIEEKVRFLAEAEGAEPGGAPRSDSGTVLIPAGSNLVFSLTSDLALPPAEQQSR
jgi:hypothetical protein